LHTYAYVNKLKTDYRVENLLRAEVKANGSREKSEGLVVRHKPLTFFARDYAPLREPSATTGPLGALLVATGPCSRLTAAAS